jgi:hypothetical protein
MPTASVTLMPSNAILPDGSSGNAAPGLTRRQGTETNPKKHFFTLDFDPSTDEFAWWTFRMPADYISGGAIKIQFMANATSGTVRWQVKVGAITPGDADTPLEHASAGPDVVDTAVDTVEARRLKESSIGSLTLDSVAAGDLVFIMIGRNASHANDSCTVDAEFLLAVFEYTA